MRFLIENMQTLARQGVKTIYMHRLLNDFNQMDLNIFGRGAKMDGMLEKYLKQLQSDPVGQFTPLEVVKVARENGIRIQSTDCLASYRYPESSLIDVQEQSIKNYLTTTIMRANEALGRSGKWVVLTGQENTNTFRGIAGLSELNGGIGLRIEEVLPERSLHIEIDHGIEVGRNASPPPLTIMAISTPCMPISTCKYRCPYCNEPRTASLNCCSAVECSLSRNLTEHGHWSIAAEPA